LGETQVIEGQQRTVLLLVKPPKVLEGEEGKPEKKRWKKGEKFQAKNQREARVRVRYSLHYYEKGTKKGPKKKRKNGEGDPKSG